MYHEDIREWLLANGLFWKDLAKTVGVSSLSHYTTTGKFFPPEWVEKWQKVYGWSDREAFLFQYGRPFQKDPQEEEDKVIKISLEKLKNLLEA